MSLLRASLLSTVVLLGCQKDKDSNGEQLLRHLKDEAMQVSALSFWNSEKDERRAAAFRRLSDIGEPAVPVLVDLLRLNRAPVSGDAFNALTNLGPRAASAVPALLELLDADQLEQRIRAAWILGSIGPAASTAVPRLTALLQHPDPRLRQIAGQALGQVGGAGHAALDRAQTSGDPRQREAALSGMAARTMDPAMRRDAVTAGLADERPEVRVRALELFSSASAQEAELLGDQLARALNDSHPRVREVAHRVLTMQLQRGRVTPRLFATLVTSGDSVARAQAAWQLGNLTREPGRPASLAPEIVQSLSQALHDDQPKIRIYAARALVYGGGESRARGIATLRREVRRGDAILRVRAARVLWDVSHDVADVRPAYEAGLADTATWNRVETLSAILDMGKAGVVFLPDVERLLNDPAPEVRDRAAKLRHALRL